MLVDENATLRVASAGGPGVPRAKARYDAQPHISRRAAALPRYACGPDYRTRRAVSFDYGTRMRGFLGGLRTYPSNPRKSRSQIPSSSLSILSRLRPEGLPRSCTRDEDGRRKRTSSQTDDAMTLEDTRVLRPASTRYPDRGSTAQDAACTKVRTYRSYLANDDTTGRHGASTWSTRPTRRAVMIRPAAGVPSAPPALRGRSGVATSKVLIVSRGGLPTTRQDVAATRVAYASTCPDPTARQKDPGASRTRSRSSPAADVRPGRVLPLVTAFAA